MSNTLCELCGAPMPKGEESFKYHGYSGNCPQPPKQDATPKEFRDQLASVIWLELPSIGGSLEQAFRIADRVLTVIPTPVLGGENDDR